MPCCFRKSRAKKNTQTEKGMEDKYYILGDNLELILKLLN